MRFLLRAALFAVVFGSVAFSFIALRKASSLYRGLADGTAPSLGLDASLVRSALERAGGDDEEAAGGELSVPAPKLETPAKEPRLLRDTNSDLNRVKTSRGGSLRAQHLQARRLRASKRGGVIIDKATGKRYEIAAAPAGAVPAGTAPGGPLGSPVTAAALETRAPKPLESAKRRLYVMVGSALFVLVAGVSWARRRFKAS